VEGRALFRTTRQCTIPDENRLQGEGVRRRDSGVEVGRVRFLIAFLAFSEISALGFPMDDILKWKC